MELIAFGTDKSWTERRSKKIPSVQLAARLKALALAQLQKKPCPESSGKAFFMFS